MHLCWEVICFLKPNRFPLSCIHITISKYSLSNSCDKCDIPPTLISDVIYNNLFLDLPSIASFSVMFPMVSNAIMMQFSGSATWPWPWLDPQLKLRQRQLHKIIMSMVRGETDPNFRKNVRFSRPGSNLPISWKRCKELLDCKICCFLCRPVDEKKYSFRSRGNP